MSDENIKVLVADDHGAIRAGLMMILGNAEGIEVVGEAADGATAVRQAKALKPDVVLMDVRMPGVDGIAATRELTAEGLCEVLVLTTFDLDEYVHAALRAGAAGFLLKSVEASRLIEAVKLVAAGRDGLLPKKFGTAHPRWGTPHRMTIAGAVLIAALAAFVPISELADMVSIGALSAMIIVAVAVPVLRKRRPDLERPFTVPFSPYLPIVAALACFYLMLNLDVMTWLRFAAWLLLGLLIYVFYGRRNSRFAKGDLSSTDRPS